MDMEDTHDVFDNHRARSSNSSSQWKDVEKIIIISRASTFDWRWKENGGLRRRDQAQRETG